MNEKLDRINAAQNLDELCDVLNEIKEDFEESRPDGDWHDGIDLTSLPIYCNCDGPDDTDDVWSWDATRLIVSATNGGFAIVDRDDKRE